MADLQLALAEAVKLNRGISQFLRFSTYTEYTDLSGLDIDFHDGEQLLLWDELRSITDKLADVQEWISYLTRPITEVSTLRKGVNGKYRTAHGHYYDCCSSIEAFVDVAGVVPSAEVTRFMTIAFYAFDIAMCAAYVILLPFVDVEKHLPQINADLLARRKAVCEAKGEVWVDPVEAERLEHEKRVAEAEENRIADLKEKCAKKGLDFDTENRKYLAKKAAKEAKKKK